MQDKYLFFRDKDGSTKYVTPCPNVMCTPDGENNFTFQKQSEMVEFLKQGFRMAQIEDHVKWAIPQGCEWLIVSYNDLPDVDNFYGSVLSPLGLYQWDYTSALNLLNGQLTYDLVKAGKIALDVSRQAVADKIALLDVPFMRALEAYIDGESDAVIEIKNKKVALRELRQPLKYLEPKTIGDINDCLKSVLEAISNHEV